ncbi:O-methylsterigmatocystin oxidoreductase Short=OMST oxidoreductase; AltName: Full=Aflatoxin B synthase; AltName: Full=Aflatoxin biosynthesis protein Q; AltName: Full=Cytochrome P450 64 [Serendipita indica DSM 11827]|nr:O-methylsterigmatocystin oxidoreductase Short=OMST oxidoreductase; AltName: Full=Aflatoxin B synthase; AltName: Full=Aflatoxin biosynthesis protein Q; AltName: Full=Cytochrome P450 64 [Serendipita indica DSM 11827]
MANQGHELRAVYSLAGGIVALGTLFVYLASNGTSAKARKANAKLPSGPKQHFALGNVFNFPKDRWYEAFTSWGKEYGDIVYVNLAGVHMMVLNSLEAVQELTVNRASIYSERPYTVMSNDLMGQGFTMILSSTGPNFTEQRKVFHKFLGKQAISNYDGLIQRHTKDFIEQINEFVGDPYDPLMKSAGDILTTIGYGEKINSEYGEILIKVNAASTNLIAWVFTKVWMVDMIPALRHVPSWMPGAGFKRTAARGSFLVNTIRHWAYSMVEAAVADGTADDSIISKQINQPGISNTNLRDAVAVMYGAGVDTTVSAIINFLYAMARHPEWQERTRKEMEVILGHDHMPTMEDISRLEIFNAVWKESFRWNPPVPLGIPHVSSKEDTWKGYYIPKGTILHCNIGQSLFFVVRPPDSPPGWILRDPRIWGNDGHQFNPNRFLAGKNPTIGQLPDVSSIPFGFGRRICPGRYLAERLALQFSAAILSTYNVLPPKGEPTQFDTVFQDSVVR